MKKYFITGDRSMHPLAAAQIVDAVIKRLVLESNGDLAVGTGNLSQGVERAVRYIVPEQLINLVSYDHDDEGNVIWTPAFEAIAPTTDEVIFIHQDPLSSHIGRALSAVFPPEKIRMPLQELTPEL
jgi:hypothetical protein